MPRNDSSSVPTVLVVDDSLDALDLVKRLLQPLGYVVYTADNVGKAVEILSQVSIDVLITDLKMPRVSGMELIRYVRDTYRDIGIVMITGYPSIDSAVESVKQGADEYLPKPFTRKELLAALEEVLEKRRQRLLGNVQPVPARAAWEGMIGESPAMQHVFSLIEKAASVKATVLITGESGTGKELVARAIHYKSDRASRAFVPVNCGGIPETLLESELFGHLKGAFTGAIDSRVGFFQTADGGTIFLDEISEMSLAMQVKLLRVLQEKEVCMVGSSRPQKVNVRIIAGTNKHLPDLIQRGRFRDDLYFRLNVISIELPPLRERGDDVLLLARHFAHKYAEEMGRPVPTFSDRVLEQFRCYPWPGNVRELENLIQRLVAMSDSDTITVSDLPPSMKTSDLLLGGGFHRSLAEVEAEYIRHVLESVKGNKTQAAKILGIDRKTLREKLEKVSSISKGEPTSPS